MILHTNVDLTLSQADRLFPSEPVHSAQGKAEEVLNSHLIVGFEEALSHGMSPLEAFGHVLNWVACEMARVKPGQGPQSTPSTTPSGDG